MKLVYIELNYLHLFIIFVFSYIIAFVSWKYVENPFRNRDTCNKKKLFFSCGALISLILTFLFLFKSNLINDNSTNNTLNSYEFSNSLKFVQKKKPLEEREKILNNLRDRKFSPGKKNILIIGDSHADDLSIILNFNKKINKSYNINLFNMESYQFYRKNFDDQNKVKRFFNSKLFKSADIIILSDRIFPIKNKNYLKWSLKGMEVLNDKSFKNDKKFFVTNPSPAFNSLSDPVTDIIFRFKNQNKKMTNKEIKNKLYLSINSEIYFIEKELKKLSRALNFEIIDKYGLLCDKKNKECSFLTDENNIIYFDKSHLTLEGCKYLSTKIDLKL